MGSPLAHTYLASPAVVAASAIKGYICGPESLVSTEQEMTPVFSVKKHPALVKEDSENVTAQVYDGFNPHLKGELVFCNEDNLNTDGIYPGKYTYQDNMEPSRMAQVVMENYDPRFAQLVKEVSIFAFF